MKQKRGGLAQDLTFLGRTGAAARCAARSVLLIVFAALACLDPRLHAESPRMSGSWKVDIVFTIGESRSLRFDAQRIGKGSFSALDPRTVVEGAGKPSDAIWTEGAGSSVTFSGPFSFPLGNVGRDPGRLTFKGKFEGENVVTGEVEFTPTAGGPAKHGTFKANRMMP